MEKKINLVFRRVGQLPADALKNERQDACGWGDKFRGDAELSVTDTTDEGFTNCRYDIRSHENEAHAEHLQPVCTIELTLGRTRRRETSESLHDNVHRNGGMN
jgi:hypothetical protein